MGNKVNNEKRKILIVDDNAIDRMLLKELLHSDFDVIETSSGEESLELMSNMQKQISAIVLDIVMPKMDGFTLMQKLRESEIFLHIPIIVSTCLEDDETREKAIVYGANGFVTKPYNRSLLLHAVKNAIRLSDMIALSERAKANEQQKKLLDNLPGGAALYEYDGKNLTIRHINESYWRLVRHKPDDYFSRSAYDGIHPDDRGMVESEIRAAIRQNRNAVIDVRILCDDDTYKPFHIIASINVDGDGKYLLFASYMPISEHKMSIKEMLPIALSTVMSTSNDYSYVKDRNLRYVCCSHSVALLLGFESERDIIGKTDSEIFDKEFAESFTASNMEIIRTGEPKVNFVERIPLKDGICFVKTSVYPVFDVAKKVIGLYGISHDISKERSLDFELNTLLYSIPSGVLKYAADESEQFEYINRNFIENLGYTEESFKEKFHNCFRDMIYYEDREAAEAEVIAQEQDGKIGKFDYRVEAADGTLRWIHDEGVKITDQNGKSWYYVSLFDITEQKEALENLRISEEINRLAIRHSGKAVTRFDVKKRILTIPETFSPIFELPPILYNMPDALINLDKISHDTVEDFRAIFSNITNGKAFGTTIYQQMSTLGWRWLEAQYTTVFSNTNQPIFAIITCADITERLEKEVVYSKWQQSLANRPKSSYTLFRCNLNKNISFDSSEGTLINIPLEMRSHTFAELTYYYANGYVYGEDRMEYLSFVNSDTMLASYYRGHRLDNMEYREICTDGTVRWIKLSAELVEYPGSKDIEVYLMYEDINESKLLELETKERAEIDSLTGIMNRATFIKCMEEEINNSVDTEKHALFILDVDNFKHVNDTYGHDVGDEVLARLAKNIQEILGGDDLVGRLGGDEFLIFLKNVRDQEEVKDKAIKVCQQKLMAKEFDNQVTLSIGVVMIPQFGKDFASLYKKVDVALYQQKNNGKNGFTFVKQ